MPSVSDKKSANINSIDRALNIMELLYHENRNMGVNEIASKLGDHQSTVHRCISTLKNRGYIYQDADSLKYGLDFKLYMLGKSVESNSVLINKARKFAKEIALEFQETVNVAIRDQAFPDDYKAITILQEKGGTRALNVTESYGASYDCITSAVGKALLAFSNDYDEDHMRRLTYPCYTSNTITNAEDYIKEIEEVRKNKYAVDNEEVAEGLYCIAVPVLKKNGEAIMAISVSGYVGTISGIGKEIIIKRLRDACNEISREIL
ncbi:MAG: IclR family transcriptional regulator [Clostridiales bacterium]|nr:IclR family transcriptional regulator [Candidatus Crickella merdequi]